jgi:site-specific recombinase XerD
MTAQQEQTTDDKPDDKPDDIQIDIDSSVVSPEVERKTQELLQEQTVFQSDADAIIEFVEELSAIDDKDIKDGRIEKYISQFGQILPHVDFSLMEAQMEDIRPLATAISNQDVAPSTRRDRRVCLNKFYKTVFPEAQRPQRIWRILNSAVTDTTHPDKGDLTRHYDFIFPDEVMEMSAEAGNKRDQLMPLFLYLTGCRLKTLREVKIKHLERYDTHHKMSLLNQKCKSLPPRRTIYETRLTHLIRNWLENHPRRDDSEAHLFCTLEDGYNRETGEQASKAGDQLSKKRVAQILENLGKAAGLVIEGNEEKSKRVNPHSFRYSMATFYNYFTELEIDDDILKKGGWKSTSQVKKYVLDPEEIDDFERKRKQGIETDVPSRFQVLAKQDCGNCNETNPPTRDICKGCGHALNDKIARERAEKEVVMVETNEKGLQGVGGKI